MTVFRDAILISLIFGCFSFFVSGQSKTRATYDVVLSDGRVIDPETKLDAIRNVGIQGGRIAAISSSPLKGSTVVDARGLIIAPGFIDWHSHGQNILSDRVHAFDGVTTALEFEMGMLPVGRWYDLQAQRGRVLNYGASSSWAIARIVTIEGVPLPAEPSPEWAFARFGLKKWPNDIATPQQVDRIVSLAEQGLKEGGIGIGIVPGYAPGSGYKELLAIQTLAEKYGVPTYSHVRSEGDVDPLSAAQAYGEMISLAAATGAHVHICHLNSTSFGDIGLAVKMIQSAQRLGARITVEAYPYEAASTAIGAAFLAAENLPRAGLTYESIEHNGVRLNKASYEALRAADPGATVVVHFYELPRDQELLDRSVLFPGGIIASDSMPWLDVKTGRPVDANVWPLPKDAFAHPRSAGTFARFFAQYVRDRKVISWSDAIAKTSYLPARYLEDAAPQMKKKGRLQVGMDADIVVFDPDTIQDRATYEHPNQTSVGMKDVLVNGVFVIRDGTLDVNAFPGRAVRRPPAPPWISTVCPAARRACSKSACQALSAESGSAAACTCGMLRGFNARFGAGTAANSAAAPSRGKSARPYTSSPARKSVTSGAIPSTTPDGSCPRMPGIRGVPSAF